METRSLSYFFFFNDPATTEIYPLSLHDALPISQLAERLHLGRAFPHEALEGHEPLDGIADLLAVLVGNLARRARRQGSLAAVLRHAARHLREALRGLQAPRHLAFFGGDSLPDRPRGRGDRGRDLAQRLGRPHERRP